MSDISDIFDMVQTESENYKILRELINDQNIELKTEINKPFDFSVLKLIAEYLRDNKLPYSASLIDKFIKISFKYLLSKNRKSREEIIRALHSIGMTETIINTNENEQIKKELS